MSRPRETEPLPPITITKALLHTTMSTMFDTLMSMPLLSGISRERLAQALSSVKLQFCKYADG